MVAAYKDTEIGVGTRGMSESVCPLTTIIGLGDTPFIELYGHLPNPNGTPLGIHLSDSDFDLGTTGASGPHTGRPRFAGISR